MSKERLLSALSESELVESKMNFDDKRLKKIRKDFNELRDRFLKAEIKKIRKKSLWNRKPKKYFDEKNKINWRKCSWIRRTSF